MELNDPLGQFEEIFSNQNDKIQTKSYFSSFGLGSNDILYLQAVAFTNLQ